MKPNIHSFFLALPDEPTPKDKSWGQFHKASQYKELLPVMKF